MAIFQQLPTRKVFHIGNDAPERLGRFHLFASDFVEKRLTDNVYERPFAICPISPKRTSGITGYAANDEQRPIFKQVTDADVHAGIDVFLIHENSLNDVLHDVFGDAVG